MLDPDKVILRRERVLQMWSGVGGRSFTSYEISLELGMTRNAVMGLVSRARARGDPRAVVRGSPSMLRDILRVKSARKGEGHSVRPPVVEKPVARKGEGHSVRPLAVKSPVARKGVEHFVCPPVEATVSVLSASFVARDGEARTVLNIKREECHFPLESATKQGFRVYCGEDARDMMRAHGRAYCREHHERMFYEKSGRLPRPYNQISVKKEDRRD